MIRRTLMLLGALLLSACASQPPTPSATPTLQLPMQLHVKREQGAHNQDWLLVIQAEGADLRWSLMDPLGIPQARQILHDGEWQADGLLPPNPEARELFAGLLFALTPEAQLPRVYPGGDWHAHDRQRRWGKHGSEIWRVHYRKSNLFELETNNGLSYEIETLDNPGPP